MDFAQISLPLLLACLAGLSTGIGSLISLFIKKFERCYLCLALGFSAGVMIYVSFTELLAEGIATLGFAYANSAFFIGVMFIMLIDFLIPHQYIAERANVEHKDRKLMMAGVFTAIGIAIHNFPEGIAVFMGALSDIHIGIPLAFAIALHNIPEGIAISMPIFYATKSRKKAFWSSFLSGLAEPLGAIIGFLILLPFLSQASLAFMLAFVAGIMVFISFDELLPISFKEGQSHLTIFGIISGMAVMALSLHLF